MWSSLSYFISPWCPINILDDAAQPASSPVCTGECQASRMRVSKKRLEPCCSATNWHLVIAPGERVQVSKSLAHKWGRNGYWQSDRCHPPPVIRSGRMTGPLAVGTRARTHVENIPTGWFGKGQVEAPLSVWLGRAPGTLPREGILGTSNMEEASGQTRNMLKGLQISSDFGAASRSPRRLRRTWRGSRMAPLQSKRTDGFILFQLPFLLLLFFFGMNGFCAFSKSWFILH